MDYADIAKQETPLDALKEFEQEFLADRLSEFEELKDFFSKSNLVEVKALAHKWKGFCEPYGFATLGKLSRSLEESVVKEDLQESSAIIDKIDLYLSAKKSHLA